MKSRWTLFYLFAAALGFRIMHLIVFANEIIPGPDQMSEIMLGRHFASGNFYGVFDTYWAPMYPLLIGIVSVFVDSLVMPAVIVSLVAGSLIVPLTYFLVRQSYGHNTAVIAASIAVFFPHLVNSVFALGSENVYIVFIISALVLFWESLRGGANAGFAFVGLALGAAYLTRPEAVGYPALFTGVLVVSNFWQKRSFIKTSLPQAALLIIAFLIVASPYLLYLRSEMGHWTVSAKSDVNTLAAEITAANSDPGGSALPTAKAIREFIKYFALNLVEANKSAPVLLPPILLMIAGAGIFGGSWTTSRIKRELYLTGFIMATVVGYAAAVVQIRYFYVILPIMLGWVALGLEMIASSIGRSLKNRPWLSHVRLTPAVLIGLILTVYLYVLPVNFYVISAEKRWHTQEYEERDAGLWLKHNGPPNARIFSTSYRPVFFAEGKQITASAKSFPEIMQQIMDQHAQYIVLSDRSERKNPHLAGFVQFVENDSRWVPVYSAAPAADYSIYVFEFRPSVE